MICTIIHNTTEKEIAKCVNFLMKVKTPKQKGEVIREKKDIYFLKDPFSTTKKGNLLQILLAQFHVKNLYLTMYKVSGVGLNNA